MRLIPSLAPPATLLARVRWLFLGFWLAFWAVLAIHVVVRQPPLIGAVGVTGMVVLAVWWLRCYQRTEFPLSALAFELPLLVVVAIAMPDPLELVYSIIPFRSVFSRGFREVLVVSTFVVLVILGVSLFVPGTPGIAAIGSEANSVVGTVGFACILFLATRTIAAVERSAIRERVVAGAVLAFGSVQSREELMNVVAHKASALFLGDGSDQVRTRVENDVEPAGPQAGGIGLPTTTSLLVDGGDGSRLRLVIEGSTASAHEENRESLSLLAHGASLALRQLSLQQILEARAAKDSLTGAINRRTFIERVTEAQTKAESGQMSLWLLFIDVDNFKMVNDTYGHHVGDAVLVAFVDRMKARFGNEDVVARLGGDEFGLLISGEPSDQSLGEVVASRVRAELAQPINIPGNAAIVVLASVGVAKWVAGMEVTDLMRTADDAMYKHKRVANRHQTLAASEPQSL